MQVLFAASEVFPLIKTGGLADVSGSLPVALAALGHDVRLVMPAYRSALAAARHPIQVVARLNLAGSTVTLFETKLPGTQLPIWLVDCPEYFDRPGNPYQSPDQGDWPDNAQRFLLFCRVIVEIAQDRAGLGWRAELVHCNDWQTGLAPALLALEPSRPATVFTIHNLAYQGVFSYDTFKALELPEYLWSYDALEFYGQFAFIKGGLVYADRINTVSPTYAKEIQTQSHGRGLDGLLRHRADALSGILNGIDVSEWNPDSDPHLAQRYTSATLKSKAVNKQDLRRRLGLDPEGKGPLIGFIGRLVEQKGIDLLLDCCSAILEQPAQIAILGSGDRYYETALRDLAKARPGALSVTIGYSEELAHRIEAGADMFLMPSRFEPCGLNQLYSLRYGTLPIVHRVGGLADTVVDAESASSGAPANGFCFDEPTPQSFRAALDRAFACYALPSRWQRLQVAAMQRDSSWRSSAIDYQNLYAQAIAENAAGSIRT